MTTTEEQNVFDRSDLCQGMPAGFESPCGIYHGPHGPHPVPPAVTSATVNRRIDGMDLTEQDMSFVIGWISSSDPRKLDDALDALETYRATRSR